MSDLQLGADTPLTLDRVVWEDGQAFVPSVPNDHGLVEEVSSHVQWLILGPPGAFAHPDLPAIVRRATAECPYVDVFYGDNAILRPDRPPDVRLKTGFDRTQLMARDYISPLLLIRTAALSALGGLDVKTGSATLFDLAWRALDAQLNIERISEVLVAAPNDLAEGSVADRLTVLRSRIVAQGEPLRAFASSVSGAIQVERTFDAAPMVTLVVPTMQATSRSGRPHIENLLESLEMTDWPMHRLNVLVGDDSSDERCVLTARRSYPIRRVPTGRPLQEPFNFAKKMNTLWRLAETEHLVLMNDDVEITNPAWLKALMTFAVEPDVGAVGARLLFPSGRLQHAGVASGLFGLCAHPWFDQPAQRPTYDNWASIQREWSAVTGAVMATRRSVLQRVNGFDERFSLDFNDIDLCFKMRTLGLRVVYNPAAELRHHEKVSRGEHPVKAEEQAIFVRRWRALLDDDPALHPKIALDSLDLAPIAELRWDWFEALRSSPAKR